MDRAGDGGRNLPRLAGARQSVGPFRAAAHPAARARRRSIMCCSRSSRPCRGCSWRGHCRAFSAAAMPLRRRRSPTSRRRGARPQFRLCWRSIRCRFRCRPAIGGFLGEIGPRAVRRRRDPCRGEYALWLFHLSRNATPRTAPDVRLAACQPARRVANDARAARNGRRRRSARAVADRQPRLSDDVELFASRSSAGAPA